MKKVRFCIEINEEIGLKIELGEVTEEKYNSIDYFEAFKDVDIDEVICQQKIRQKRAFR